MVKRESELNCPTDIRKTVPWCAGEDAIFCCPCFPDGSFYGHKPTCWRTWPAPGAVWRDLRCANMPCSDGNCPVPAFEGQITPLPPVEAPPVGPEGGPEALPPATSGEPQLNGANNSNDAVLAVVVSETPMSRYMVAPNSAAGRTVRGVRSGSTSAGGEQAQLASDATPNEKASGIRAAANPRAGGSPDDASKSDLLFVR
jgi:hypothetical protein